MSAPTAAFEVHMAVDCDGLTAVQHLAGRCPLSKQQIKQTMHKGAVWLARGAKPRRLRRAGRVLHSGDRLHLYYNPEVLAQAALPPRLIADEGAYSIWCKRSGMPVQGSKWGDHCTLGRWAEQHLQPQRPGYLVHRLDRAASGLILIAHSKTAAAALSQLFRQRAVEKHYRVTVDGEFPPQPLTLDTPVDRRPAVSHIRRLGFDPGRRRSSLHVRIETGRKHQIRRHLADFGFAVTGDRLYGSEVQTEDLQLTACCLSFRCPLSGEQKHFTLPDHCPL